jgi:hypothetical protein
MIEDEWLVCTQPKPMLEFMQSKASDRKLRLFAVACCRRIWSLLRDNNHQKAVEVAERYADGKATLLQLQQAEHHAAFRVRRVGGARQKRIAAAEAASRAVSLSPATTAEYAAEASEVPELEHEVQCGFLRDLFRYPRHPVSGDPSWLTWNSGTIPTIAQEIYEKRSFDALLILADALEEAGCKHTDLLNHCRQECDHIQGCWVVDLLLGKT